MEKLGRGPNRKLEPLGRADPIAEHPARTTARPGSYRPDPRSRRYALASVRPSPARSRPHDAGAWFPLPDVDELPPIDELIGADVAVAAPPRDRRARRRCPPASRPARTPARPPVAGARASPTTRRPGSRSSRSRSSSRPTHWSTRARRARSPITEPPAPVGRTAGPGGRTDRRATEAAPRPQPAPVPLVRLAAPLPAGPPAPAAAAPSSSRCSIATVAAATGSRRPVARSASPPEVTIRVDGKKLVATPTPTPCAPS